MTKFFIVISLTLVIAGGSVATAFAQEKPLGQSEYVRLLYAAKGAGDIRTLVDSLRRRGISFPVTDGIRGLTRTKSANNDDLKRALEEADRRRLDPESAKIPPPAAADEILRKTSENTLALLEQMPDFVVKQIISRSESYAGTGNWRPYDNLIIAVSYSDEKGEQYKVLSKNGAPVDIATAGSYSGLDGATSGGEFIEDVTKIFKPESKATFRAENMDMIRGQRTVVFSYAIELANNKKGGVGLKGPVYSSSPAGEKGRIWIDPQTARVLRLEYQLTDIDPGFAVKAVTKTIDYDMVAIAGEKYLMPVLSDFRGTVENSGKRFEQRNLIRFRNYQKYGSEVKVLDDDLAPPVDEKKP